MDSLKTEVAPFLSAKQKEILDNELEHFNNPSTPRPPLNDRRMPQMPPPPGNN